MDNSTKTINFKYNNELCVPTRIYLSLDYMMSEYLGHVRASEVDVFGNLHEHLSYKNALACLNMLFMMGLVDGEEYGRVAGLFHAAHSEAMERHNRLKQALERRERMRGIRANRATAFPVS